MAKTRALRVKLVQLAQTQFSNVNKVYYIKNVYYGRYCDTYDYRTVKVSYKQAERTYRPPRPYKRSDFALARAREKLYRIVIANTERFANSKKTRTVFFTLTTKDQIKDHKESNKKIKSFVRRLNEYCGFKIYYLIVPELHKSNAIHYHGIFFNLPYIPIRTFSREIWGYGHTDLQLPKSIRNIASYISKYLTKSFSENTPKNTKTYFCSRGLIQPKEDYTDSYPSGIIETHEITVHRAYLKIKHKLHAENHGVCFGQCRNIQNNRAGV